MHTRIYIDYHVFLSLQSGLSAGRGCRICKNSAYIILCIQECVHVCIQECVHVCMRIYVCEYLSTLWIWI